MANLSMERTGRITGSRIAGVLGLSPYATRNDVMREMVREYYWDDAEFNGNFVTDYGVEHEPDAIRAYEAKTGYAVENTVISQDQLTYVSADEMFAVTPDGWLTDVDPDGDGLLEAKCPFRATYTHIDQRPDYYAQIQAQLWATNRAWADFAVWRHEGTTISRAHANPDWMKAQFPELERFLEEYREIIESEELSAPYRAEIEDQRTDQEWLQAVAEYYDLVADIDHANQQLAKAKEALAKLAGNATAKGGGLQVIRRVAKGGGGAVAYKKAFEELGKRFDVPAPVMAEIKAEATGKPSPGGGVTWAFKNIQDKEDKA